MKRTLLLLTLFLGLFVTISIVSAVNLNVEKISSDEVMIVGLEDPAQFEVNVTNNGLDDFFSFYTFFGLGLEPRNAIKIQKGETKQVTLKVFPREDSSAKGYYSFSYFIQGKDTSEVEEKLTLNIIELKDAFEIGSQSIDPESNTLQIYIHNKVNFDFTELDVRFKSPFFDLEESFSLGPNERRDFKIDLEKEEFNKLMAGFYTLTAEIKTKGLESDVEGKIEFVEKDLLKTEKKDYGLVISTKVIEKTNEGNTIVNSVTTLKKNIISRAFTSFSPEPSIVDREGTVVYYTWNNEINPGESFEITVKTNWLLPFAVIILIILIIIFAKRYSSTDLALRKRVSFVRARGGEFALKVTIMVEAKNYVEKIRVLDKLPPLVKIYEKFLGEYPTRIDKGKKKLEWEFDHLEPGERRVLSYVIYSKVGVLGRFALPGTVAMFEKEGKLKQTSSNKAYFLSRQRDKSDF